MRRLAVSLTLFVCAAVPCRAQGSGESAPVFKRYVTVLATTTLAYRPPGGPSDGWQRDVTPQIGFGYNLTPRVALELDLGPTYVEGEYAGFSLVPGALLSLGPRFYASLRFVVPVDPETNLAVSPGLGAVLALGSRDLLYVEADIASFVGRGDADLGLTLTTGFLRSF